MESIRELSQSIGAYLRGRVVNPLYGGYLVAWAVINFRLLLVLLSDGTAQAKIQHIDKRLYTEWWHWGLYAFALPMVVAASLVWVTPLVARAITLYLRGQEKRTVEELLRIEGITPLDPEKAAELRRSVISERELRLKQREAFELQVGELSNQVDVLITQNLDLKAKIQAGTLGADPQEDEAKTGEVPSKVSEEAGTGRVTNAQDSVASFSLRESDFLGINQRTVLRLVTRGISTEQAQALFILRNGNLVSQSQLASKLGFTERFKLQLLIDQMTSLELATEESFRDEVKGLKITKVGRQALEAILRRGFLQPNDTTSAA